MDGLWWYRQIELHFTATIYIFKHFAKRASFEYARYPFIDILSGKNSLICPCIQ